MLPQRGRAGRARADPRRGRLRGHAAAQAHAAPLPARGRLPGAPPVVLRDPYSFAPDARRARPPPRHRGPPRAALERARRASADDRRLARDGLRGVGARGARGQPSSATSTPGTSARIRCARSARPASGSCSCPEAAEGHAYKFAIRGADGEVRLKADPLALRAELPPKTGSVVHEPGPRLARRRRGRSAGGRAEPHARADVGLRGAPRLLAPQHARGQPLADLRRARRRARRLRARARLHARRADARDGAPVHRLLGLPGDRLLRPDVALRHAGRVPRASSTGCTRAASA